MAFEEGDLAIHQSLAVRPRAGDSRMPLSPDWATRVLAAAG